MNETIDLLFEQRVIQSICERCGTDFDKPGSCEECLEDKEMQTTFKYEIKRAKEMGENYFLKT